MHHLVQEIGELCQHVTFGLQTWHEPLKRLALLTGSMRAQLIGIGGPSVTPFNCVPGEPDDAFDALIDIQGYHPDVNFRVATSVKAAAMEVIHEAHYQAAHQQLTSDIYIDYCNERDIPFGCQTRLFADDEQLIGLATLRTRGDGVTSKEQRALFAEAAIHIRSAVETQIQIERQGKALMVGALDAIAASALLIDGFGRVCAITPSAEARLRRGGRLTVQDGRITSGTRAGAAEIDRALGRVLSDLAPPGGIDVALPPTPLDRMPLLLSFKSLQPLAASLGIQPRVIVTVDGGLMAGGDPVRRLRRAFDLTEAEAQVALALSRGIARREIALQRQVSLDTLRSQIKAIFRKVGVGREGELVSLMLGG